MQITKSDALASLRSLPAASRIVSHRPETPRYARARVQLAYVVSRSVALGVRAGEAGLPVAVEIALWVSPPSGRGYGFYSCFRLLRDAGVVTAAVLFCFYDGTERSPGFRTETAAQSFARSQGFQEVVDDAQDRG